MDESLAFLKNFLSEDEVSAEGAPIESVEKSPRVDDTQPKAVKASVSTKKPALRVLEGGQKGVRAIQDVTPSISDIPTPGGIGLLLLIIFIMLFAIIKTTSGHTRLGLVWSAINGSAALGSAASAIAAGGPADIPAQIPGAPDNAFLLGHLGR